MLAPAQNSHHDDVKESSSEEQMISSKWSPFVQCNSQNKLTRATKTSEVEFGSFRTSAQKTAKCVQTSTVLTRRHLALIHIYKRGTKFK